MGLLNVIRMTDPDLNTLSLGTDLTALGLNLNSSEYVVLLFHRACSVFGAECREQGLSFSLSPVCRVLYATFAYPCAETPTKRDPEYVLPYCYYMQPPALKTSHLAKFQLETLFYIFYSMPKDTLQVYAAKEL